MKNIIKLILIPVCLLFLTSCDDMNSLHQEYLDKGETTYPGKIESVEVFRGKNKVKFIWEIKADPRITETEISWLEGIDRKEVKVNVTEKRPAEGGPVTVDVTIDQLPETDLYFEFVTIDALGNRSVALGAVVPIYGDSYIGTLRPRRISITPGLQGQPIKLTWTAADNVVVRTILKYVSTSGPVELTILPNESVTLLSNFNGGQYTATTYCAVENGLETIELATVTGTIFSSYMFDRTDWIIGVDSRHPWGRDGAGAHLPQEDGGLPFLIKDGDPTSGWHTNTGRYCPHYLWADMIASKTVTHIRIVNNPNGLGYLNSIRVFKSIERPSRGFTDDNWVEDYFTVIPDHWELVTDFLFPSNVTEYMLELPEPLDTQYLIFWFPDTQAARGGQRYISFTELEVYGVD
jgi:hypothetical protein